MYKKIFFFIAGFAVIVLAVLGFNFKGHFFPAASGATNLTLGDLVKLADNSAVYLVGQDGKRYVFPNEAVYYSWYAAADFATVKTITASEMAGLPIGGNVTVRPGTKLVKITTDPKVYAVTNSGLRWVSTEAIATELYGSNWAKRVVDVPDTFWLNYSFGSAIETPVHPEGALIKSPTNGAIYLMKENGKVDVFNTYSGFSGNGFKESDVIETTKSYETSGSSVSRFDNVLRYPDKALTAAPKQNQCSDGETKKYTCKDGTQVPWCSCENGQWTCVISPEIQCPAEECSDGETKKYTCKDGTQVPWCSCENGQWTCVISPEIQCPAQECSTGETKKYTCKDGTQVPWCGCDNGQWTCVISPEIQCPAESK